MHRVSSRALNPRLSALVCLFAPVFIIRPLCRSLFVARFYPGSRARFLGIYACLSAVLAFSFLPSLFSDGTSAFSISLAVDGSMPLSFILSCRLFLSSLLYVSSSLLTLPLIRASADSACSLAKIIGCIFNLFQCVSFRLRISVLCPTCAFSRALSLPPFRLLAVHAHFVA